MSDLLTKTVEVNGARLTVRRATIGDRLTFRRYYRALLEKADPDVDDTTALFQVAEMLAMTEGLDMDIPAPGADDQAIYDAYQEFILLDARIFDALEKALKAVNAPLADEVEGWGEPTDPKS